MDKNIYDGLFQKGTQRMPKLPTPPLELTTRTHQKILIVLFDSFSIPVKSRFLHWLRTTVTTSSLLQITVVPFSRITTWDSQLEYCSFLVPDLVSSIRKFSMLRFSVSELRFTKSSLSHLAVPQISNPLEGHRPNILQCCFALSLVCYCPTGLWARLDTMHPLLLCESHWPAVQFVLLRFSTQSYVWTDVIQENSGCWTHFASEFCRDYFNGENKSESRDDRARHNRKMTTVDLDVMFQEGLNKFKIWPLRPSLWAYCRQLVLTWCVG